MSQWSGGVVARLRACDVTVVWWRGGALAMSQWRGGTLTQWRACDVTVAWWRGGVVAWGTLT